MSGSFSRQALSVVVPSLFRPSLVTLIDSLCGQAPGELLVIGGGNPAQQRNEGIERTKGEVVVFLDDDVFCESGCLDVVVEEFRDGVVDLLSLNVIGPGSFRVGESYVHMTAGLAVRRKVVDSIQFDPRLRVMEDIDFGWRVIDAGFRHRIGYGAVVRHPGEPASPLRESKQIYQAVAQHMALTHPRRWSWLLDHNSSQLGIEGRPRDTELIRGMTE